MGESYDAAVRAAEAALQAARRLLNDEISGYPGPIASCDAQFNHLPAERRRVTDSTAVLGREVFVPTPRSPLPGAGVETR